MYLKLKSMMIEKEITQKKLAELLDLNVSTVNFKINGKKDFTLSEARKISSIFDNKPIEEIFLIS
ncbi:helix-turn-helix transcriptional regulator [Clostridium sp.]|uniref:helix-turn-helix transcriptional regulator n=1 Tax=Clostridium sp. TaxID=1506 RepID=UPI003996C04E